ncbi:hypothetical protein B6U74_06050 [Candidatus Bathyarchaeota archaeon ex4484_205]|nr:MAG: hypothetical protein B6U74_06050 [Candidatus Bathyarchaeota archaeon ex4484_205]
MEERGEGCLTKLPFCDFCIRSGVLCNKCVEKIRRGENTQLDLEISRYLLSANIPAEVRKITFYRSIEGKNILTLIVEKGDALIFQTKGRKLVRKLSERFGRRIMIIERGVKDKELLEKLFSPMKILTLNTIWLPDGSKQTRVILARAAKYKLDEEDVKIWK